MEYTLKPPQDTNTEKIGPHERVLIVDDTTISKPQLTHGEEKPNSSNLASSSSSLSEVDINKTEGDDYYSQLLAEAECVLQTEKTSGKYLRAYQFLERSINSRRLGVSTPTPKPTSKLNYVPRFFINKQMGTYAQYIPDDGDPHYFCRVCQTRSASKSAYHEHLTARHKMLLLPIEHWRPDHPEIIPAEFDNSNCCSDCQKVFSANLHYRQHLEEVHRFHFIKWKKEERQARIDAIFHSTESVVQFIKLYTNPTQTAYACSQCPKVFKVLRSFVKHYFNEHKIIAELHMLEDKDMNKENTG